MSFQNNISFQTIVNSKKYNNIDKNFLKCNELSSLFGSRSRGTTLSRINEFLEKHPKLNDNIKTLFNDILKIKGDYIKISNKLVTFARGHTDGYNGNFLEIFSNENELIDFNSFMNKLYSVCGVLKNIDELYEIVGDDRPLLEYFTREELCKENSDYFIGTYSSGNFIEYPTRVYYGLHLQWSDLNNWEMHKGENIKTTTISNKEKFEFFIQDDKHALLKDLANRMGTELEPLIQTLRNIVDVDNYYSNLDDNNKYILRAFYLYKYIVTSGGKSSIVTNKSGTKFLKKTIKNGKEKDGTFLSILYDKYNESQPKLEKKIKRKRKTKPKRITKPKKMTKQSKPFVLKMENFPELPKKTTIKNNKKE